MNDDLSTAAQCYGLYDEGEIIGFCAVLHQPHGVIKNLKRCSRIVILPDYQGIGLGTRFLNSVAEHYKRLGFRFSIVTSAKNMIYALKKSDKWIMNRYGRSQCVSKKSKLDCGRKSIRSNCKTAGFYYK